MKNNITSQLAAFNQTYKEMDKIYHDYAKAFGLSDAVLWVLYSMWEHKEAYLQSELCTEWFYSPQTVNSALKSLEKQGLIELVFRKGSRKSKEVHFTDAGRALAEKVIEPLMQAENAAFSKLSEQERSALLSASQKNTLLLEQEVKNVLPVQ